MLDITALFDFATLKSPLINTGNGQDLVPRSSRRKQPPCLDQQPQPEAEEQSGTEAENHQPSTR